MKVLLMEVETFDKEYPNVVADDIGLTKHEVLGKEVYTYCSDEELGRDDSIGGKQGLAQKLESLKAQLETVRLEGENGFYIGGTFDVWVESEITEEIKRLERFPELEYSTDCYKAWTWFTTRGELLDL